MWYIQENDRLKPTEKVFISTKRDEFLLNCPKYVYSKDLRDDVSDKIKIALSSTVRTNCYIRKMEIKGLGDYAYSDFE